MKMAVTNFNVLLHKIDECMHTKPSEADTLQGKSNLEF